MMVSRLLLISFALASSLVAPALALAAEQAPAMIEKPLWSRRPTGEDVQGSYPEAAKNKDQGGDTRLICLVRADGWLEQCRVVFELPLEFGFGAASLALAPKFRLEPIAGDGKPVAGRMVDLPIVWRVAGGVEPGAVLTKPLWRKTPTRDQLAAAFPAGAKSIDRANVALTCRVEPLAT